MHISPLTTYWMMSESVLLEKVTVPWGKNNGELHLFLKDFQVS
jgi:hypothetical protein